MFVWIGVIFCVQGVLGAYQVRDLHVRKWCAFFNTFSDVYTTNQWHNCGKKNDFDQLEVFTKQMQNLRVAVIQDVMDFRHDCWAVSKKSGGVVLEDSYASFILQVLQDVLKFQFTIVSERKRLHNSTAKSRERLVQMLVKNEADIGVCHLTVTPERINSVDFLHSTLTSSRALVFDPSHLSLLEDVFVLTFSATLWACFFLALALLTICFRFSTWMHSFVRPDHEPWSWFEVILWAIAAVCQQSFSRHPKGLSCRTMFFIGYIITYLLYTGFAAGVTSLLAVQGRDVKLTLNDVFSMKLKLVTTAFTTHHSFIKGLGSKTANFDDRIDTQVVENHDELFKRLDADNLVGFGSTVNLENYIRERIPNSRKKNLMISVLPKTITQESLIVQKNSPLKEIFSYWLLRMQEVGLLSLGQDRYLKVEENKDLLPGWSSASLSNVFSALLILVGGLFFSVLILFCEMAWMRKKTSTAWEKRTKQDIHFQYRHFHQKKHSEAV